MENIVHMSKFENFKNLSTGKNMNDTLPEIRNLDLSKAE